MSEKTLKFGNVVIHKKEFHASKKAIALSSVDTDKIVISEKVKHDDKGSKYFIGYMIVVIIIIIMIIIIIIIIILSFDLYVLFYLK